VNDIVIVTETKTLPEDIDVLVDGVRELRDGVEEFTDDGVTVLKDEIIEGVDDIKFGKAMEDEITKLAQNYTSFMDNDKNINSSVQFIMQTEEIKIHEAKILDELENLDNKTTFWQKLVNLFKK